jgi:hypothetical protein
MLRVQCDSIRRNDGAQQCRGVYCENVIKYLKNLLRDGPVNIRCTWMLYHFTCFPDKIRKTCLLCHHVLSAPDLTSFSLRNTWRTSMKLIINSMPPEDKFHSLILILPPILEPCDQPRCLVVRVSDYWSLGPGFDSRLSWGFSLEGEYSHSDHGLGSLAELRFKAPPGTSYSYITNHLIGTT